MLITDGCYNFWRVIKRIEKDVFLFDLLVPHFWFRSSVLFPFRLLLFSNVLMCASKKHQGRHSSSISSAAAAACCSCSCCSCSCYSCCLLPLLAAPACCCSSCCDTAVEIAGHVLHAGVGRALCTGFNKNTNITTSSFVKRPLPSAALQATSLSFASSYASQFLQPKRPPIR